MALKLFQKEVEVQTENDARTARLEKAVEELTLETGRLRAEIDGMTARQQGFRLALRRLREYLEERGIEARASKAEASGSKEEPAALPAPAVRKDKGALH